MGFREGEDNEGVGQVLLSPDSEIGLTFLIDFNEILEAFFVMGAVVGVENNSAVRSDLTVGVPFNAALSAALRPP